MANCRIANIQCSVSPILRYVLIFTYIYMGTFENQPQITNNRWVFESIASANHKHRDTIMRCLTAFARLYRTLVYIRSTTDAQTRKHVLIWKSCSCANVARAVVNSRIELGRNCHIVSNPVANLTEFTKRIFVSTIFHNDCRQLFSYVTKTSSSIFINLCSKNGGNKSADDKDHRSSRNFCSFTRFVLLPLWSSKNSYFYYIDACVWHEMK